MYMDSNLDIELNKETNLSDLLHNDNEFDKETLDVLTENISSNIRKDYVDYNEKVNSVSIDKLKKFFDLGGTNIKIYKYEPSHLSILFFLIGAGALAYKIRSNNVIHLTTNNDVEVSKNDNENDTGGNVVKPDNTDIVYVDEKVLKKNNCIFKKIIHYFIY